MMKTKSLPKFTSAALALLLALGATLTVFAAGFDYSKSYLLRDEADLYPGADYDNIKEKLDSVGKQTGWQVAVVTTENNVSSSRMDTYYNNYYDNNRSFFQSDSVMFVIDNASGNRIIITHGAAEQYFTDARMSEMKNALKPFLSGNDMLNAAYTFADKTLEFYQEGVPLNGTYENHVEGTESEDDRLKRENKLLYVLTRWGWLMGLIGLAAGGIFAGVNIGRYKFNGKSGTYDLRENSSMKLVDSQDVFLHKHTTSTTISSGSSSGGSKGGGSSSHGSSGSF